MLSTENLRIRTNEALATESWWHKTTVTPYVEEQRQRGIIAASGVD